MAFTFTWPRVRVGQFGAAVAGAVLGGFLSFGASWWQTSAKDSQQRQASACVLGGELQVVHLALLTTVKAGNGPPEQTLGALKSLQLMNINPSANTWGLAVNLEPALARDISRFRASLTGIFNSLAFSSDHPIDMLPHAGALLRKYEDMAGVSGSFSKQLQLICERGGAYTPSKDEATFTIDLGKDR